MRRQNEPQTGNWEWERVSAVPKLFLLHTTCGRRSGKERERIEERERDPFVMLILHCTSKGSPAVARRLCDLLWSEIESSYYGNYMVTISYIQTKKGVQFALSSLAILGLSTLPVSGSSLFPWNISWRVWLEETDCLSLVFALFFCWFICCLFHWILRSISIVVDPEEICALIVKVEKQQRREKQFNMSNIILGGCKSSSDSVSPSPFLSLSSPSVAASLSLSV